MTEAVTLTNPDRVLWPGMGLTKSDLANYYRAVADLMMPHMVRRPVTLVRCPQGRQRKCFFQRHHVAGFPEQFHPVDLRDRPGEGRAKGYLYIDEAEGLIAGCSSGCSSSTSGARRLPTSSAPTGWCSTSIRTPTSTSRRCARRRSNLQASSANWA
jgi:bifunctional non-homologous end joining protein LigD